ncbi:Paramyosin, short form [Cryptotermes secundus]|uniref:Paramyosin n=3 Tax=Cryptotermes secundus TaxID=105785 RepID=A0A2J7RDG4_9NEOP|nr:Paramyosin, short form [Cryptotermes secundus]
MSLDVANKNNIELQKTIKKQSLTLTELQAHYDEVQRQLQVTLDQYGIAQRKLQSITAELEEVRGNYEAALRAKRTAEQLYEEAISRVNELTTINVNLASAKSKVEQELATLAGDYDEVTRELKAADERYQRVQIELKHTVEILHEEQERIVKIEAIKKSLEIEVKNLSVRLEEVEANAIAGGKRIISKLEARLRDLELELDEEKRRHAETLKILRKKERQVKEVLIQSEEDQKNVSLLQESLDKLNQRVSIYKRQLQEQEGMSQQSVTRVRRFQRELEAAEDRADTAESNLSLIRAKHRTFVTTSTVPGSQVYLVQETHRTATTEGI